MLTDGRTVAIRAWRYDLVGITGHTIPIYLLDTDLEQNDPRDRALTDHLYGGDGSTIGYGRRRCWALAAHASWRRCATGRRFTISTRGTLRC